MVSCWRKTAHRICAAHCSMDLIDNCRARISARWQAGSNPVRSRPCWWSMKTLPAWACRPNCWPRSKSSMWARLPTRSARSRMWLLSLAVFEKEGSFVNLSFRLQKFAAAVPGPRGILPDVAVLEKIAAPLADEKPAAAADGPNWAAHCRQGQPVQRHPWRGIGSQGVAVDPAPSSTCRSRKARI